MPRPPPTSTVVISMRRSRSCLTSAATRATASPSGDVLVSCEPMCMSAPTTWMPGRRPASSNAASAWVYGMPNFALRSPVAMYLCVCGSTSGFTRSATGARVPTSRATSSSARSSPTDSTLNRRIGLEGVAHLVARLADAREDDLLRRHARAQRAVQLAARDDIGAGAHLGQRGNHPEIRVRLDRIANEMRDVLERVVVGGVAREQGGLRVDVGGRADGVGELRQRQHLAAELAVAIREVGGGGHVQEIVAHRGREVKAR